MRLALSFFMACGPRAEPAGDAADPPSSGDTSGAAHDTADTADRAAAGVPLWITEAMADNHATLEDADGDTPDWIELYNPGPEPVDLTGWTLADEGDAMALSGVLLGGDFLVVYASGEDRPAERHAPFQLDADGEALTLTRPDGSVAHAVDLPALPEDVAWGLAQGVETTTLVTDGAAAVIAHAEAPGWTEAGFDDAAWAPATLAVGFDGSAAGSTSYDASLDRPATQSSDYPGFLGAYAVDGDPATFSHTDTADLAPWWEVDLEADHVVATIGLLNRSGCCPERLYNVVVTASDAEGAVVWTSEVLNPVAEGGTPTDPGGAFSFVVDPPVTARTVRVSKTAVGGTYAHEWLSLAEVVVTGTLAAPYADAIATEVAAAPVYVRAPFSLDALPTRATLSVAYDDAFTAAVNGVDVAAANLGQGVALAAHDGDAAETFVLDPRAFAVGENVLAMAALGLGEGDDDLLLRPKLTAHAVTTGEPVFFDAPTPGEPNGAGFDGFVDAPTVDPPRGFYDAAFTATITAPPGATLVYTTDGSAPALDNGTVVEAGTASLEVTTTTLLRAAALRDGYAPSDVATHSYLFLADVIRQPATPAGWPATWDGVSEAPVSGDYEMDPEIVDPDPAAIVDALRSLPTLSIVTAPDALFGPDGLYENSAERGEAWERAVSVEYILPDGSTGFAEDCGLRVHGWGWRYHSSTKKHSFRLEFSRDYGDTKLAYPLFADSDVDRFDSIVLRAGGSKTWLDFRDPAQAQYLHDAFARDTARDMGKLDGHATFVHLYLNGLYWGLYDPVERPEAGFGEEYLGGDDEEYDAINRRTFTNEAVDGTLEAFEAMLALADADLSDAAAYAALEAMVDVDDLVDYMLIHQYMVNRDGPCCAASNNMRALRRRADGNAFRFFVWDMEYSLWEATDDTNVVVDVAGSASHVYTRLATTDAFRARYAERARLHLTGDGALTPTAAAARYAARAEEIFAALLAESARWGDTYRETPYTRDVEWQAEYDRLMDEYFPRRTEELIGQLEGVGLY